jgi:hypothetical protein
MIRFVFPPSSPGSGVRRVLAGQAALYGVLAGIETPRPRLIDVRRLLPGRPVEGSS